MMSKLLLKRKILLSLIMSIATIFIVFVLNIVSFHLIPIILIPTAILDSIICYITEKQDKESNYEK